MSKHKQKAAPAEQEEVQGGPYEETEQAQAPQEQPNYYEQYVRLSADFENFRRRTIREKAALFDDGKKEFALKMLPMYEVLLRQQARIQSAKADNEHKEFNELKEGMRMILTELDKAFKSEGITKMDVLKKPYDPASQEVVAMIPSGEEDDGLVLDEIQMGFMMNGQVLRPARVVVGQHTEEA